jgi:hypothetical protein
MEYEISMEFHVLSTNSFLPHMNTYLHNVYVCGYKHEMKCAIHLTSARL